MSAADLPIPARRARHRAVRAFTLVELLAVVAIMALLLSLGSASFFHIGRSHQLTAAGNGISHLAHLAHQEAITQNTPSALVFLKPVSEAVPGAFAVLLLQDDRWKQISKWEILPEGIVLDEGASSFLQNAALPPIVAGGAAIARFREQAVTADACAARVFLPGAGSLWNPDQPATLRLVERAGGAASQNYYDITLLGPTGLARIERR